MKKFDENTKTGLAYLLAGTALMALATKPPRTLTRIYLAIERICALVLGFAMALAGLAVLLRKEDEDPIIAAEAEACEAAEQHEKGEN